VEVIEGIVGVRGCPAIGGSRSEREPKSQKAARERRKPEQDRRRNTTSPWEVRTNGFESPIEGIDRRMRWESGKTEIVRVSTALGARNGAQASIRRFATESLSFSSPS
jgi:hypothetical protein